jgi:hypothetical protein
MRLDAPRLVLSDGLSDCPTPGLERLLEYLCGRVVVVSIVPLSPGSGCADVAGVARVVDLACFPCAAAGLAGGGTSSESESVSERGG